MPRAASPTTSSAKIVYDVHPSVKMVQDWIAKLPEKTGRSLDEWIALVKKSGPPTEVERREWLKREHGHGTNSAWWIAARAEGREAEDGDPRAYLNAAVRYVEAMYSGSKAGMRPIHDALIALCRSLGKDVKVCPCQTMVPLYRNHVFAQVKPSTRTRIDFGLALGNMKTPKRLIDTGGFAKKDRITRKIEITSVGQIDAEVKKWLQTAYELDA
jgi:hypothetical protein